MTRGAKGGGGAGAVKFKIPRACHDTIIIFF